MVFDGIWWQLTNIISSFYFNEVIMAANNSSIQFMNMTDLIGNGFGVNLSSKLSQYLGEGKVKKAKKAYLYFVIQQGAIAVCYSLFLSVCAEWLSEKLLKDPEARVYMVSILRHYAITVPFQLFYTTVFAVCRATK
jgi:Na+-driven multidrug efflux pump